MCSIKRFFFKYKKVNYKMNIFIEIVGNCGAYLYLKNNNSLYFI